MTLTQKQIISRRSFVNWQWLSCVRWAVCLCFLATCASGLSANTFDVEAFKSANVEQQREILRTSIETWLAGLRNCQFTSTTRSGERVVNGGKVQESDDWSTTLEFVIRRVDESYWLQTKMFANDLPSGPFIESESSFDRDEGESRGLMITNGGRTLLQGRRDSIMDDSVYLNPASQYLCDTPDPEGIRLYSALLASMTQWKCQLVEGAGEVVIEYPYRHPKLESNEVDGTCTISFSYNGQFVPVRYTQSYCLTFSPRKPTQRLVARFSKADSDNRLAVPLLIEEVVTSSAMGEDKCIFTKTDIKDMTLGHLTKTDLALKFPVGTRVVDVIDGVSYTVESDSKKTTVKQPLDQVPLTKTGDVYRRSWSPVTVVVVTINCLLLGWLVARMIFSARARKRNTIKET